MKARNVLSQIKRDLEPFVGHKIKLKANKGRRNIVEREGVLERTYPSIFVVRLDEKRHTGRKVAFSYADILTEAVELVVVGKNGDQRFQHSAQS